MSSSPDMFTLALGCQRGTQRSLAALMSLWSSKAREFEEFWNKSEWIDEVTSQQIHQLVQDMCVLLDDIQTTRGHKIDAQDFSVIDSSTDEKGDIAIVFMGLPVGELTWEQGLEWRVYTPHFAFNVDNNSAYYVALKASEGKVRWQQMGEILSQKGVRLAIDTSIAFCLKGIEQRLQRPHEPII
jgi:hypothetical protein